MPIAIPSHRPSPIAHRLSPIAIVNRQLRQLRVDSVNCNCTSPLFPTTPPPCNSVPSDCMCSWPVLAGARCQGLSDVIGRLACWNRDVPRQQLLPSIQVPAIASCSSPSSQSAARLWARRNSHTSAPLPSLLSSPCCPHRALLFPRWAFAIMTALVQLFAVALLAPLASSCGVLHVQPVPSPARG